MYPYPYNLKIVLLINSYKSFLQIHEPQNTSLHFAKDFSHTWLTVNTWSTSISSEAIIFIASPMFFNPLNQHLPIYFIYNIQLTYILKMIYLYLPHTHPKLQLSLPSFLLLSLALFLCNTLYPNTGSLCSLSTVTMSASLSFFYIQQFLKEFWVLTISSLQHPLHSTSHHPLPSLFHLSQKFPSVSSSPNLKAFKYSLKNVQSTSYPPLIYTHLCITHNHFQLICLLFISLIWQFILPL